MKKKGLAAIILSICFVFVAAYAVIDTADNAVQPQTADTTVAAVETAKTADVSEQVQNLAADYTKTADTDNEKKNSVFDQYLDSAVTLAEAEEAAEQAAGNDLVTMLMEQKMNKDKGQLVADKRNDNTDPDQPFDITHPEIIEEGDVVYSEDTLMIKFKDSFNGKVNDDLKAAGVAKLEVIFEMEGYTWYTAYLNEKADAQESLAAVRELKKVAVAEYNYQYETTSTTSFDAAVESNPSAGDQHHHKQCHIKDGWKHLQDKKGNETINGGGDSSVVVAVIDTGVDYNHEDLKSNMWFNSGEVDGNGIDDDNNGYVDDYYGVDMTADDGSSSWNRYNGSGMDDNGHGTHVAGIIAASNNKTGVVGIAYNTKIMAIKAGDASGYFMQSNIAEAIMYAYDHGADVINMSFGGSASSIAVQDALATAYSRCVLVASAGNKGAPNQASDYYFPDPSYPAAFSYVLGVMSVDSNNVESSFTNWDTLLFNSVEYEVYAPGGQILSTIPGNKYAKMSGTSMAAPVVSAQAAILRSLYDERDTYPTKFIYGQIVGTADDVVKCINPQKHTVGGFPHNIPGVVNFYRSMTELPTPDVGMSDYTLFDTESYVADTEGITGELITNNNGDGIIDSGEVIALGLTLKNRWGKSENTTISINADSSVGVANPYVTFLNNDINYGSVGTYSENDCGKLYTEDGEMWNGWENPFYIKIADNCPNDYSITLNVTITCENALDPDDTTVYTSEETILLTVRRGEELPNIIREDMTLTKDKYYIIPNAMTVMEGATLRIEEGTQIQFWCSDPQDSYADTAITYLKVNGKLICEGTEEEPIEMFPSGWMDRYRVEIYTAGNGYASMKYTNVVNPHLTIDKAEKCEFTQNYKELLFYRYLSGGQVHNSNTNGTAVIKTAKDCAFYKVSFYNLYGKVYEGCIFVDSSINYRIETVTECVFYGNNNYWDNDYGWTSSLTYEKSFNEVTVEKIFKDKDNGKTYAVLDLGGQYLTKYKQVFSNCKIFNNFANTLGGEILSINTMDEYELIKQNVYNCVHAYSYDKVNDKYYNFDGSAFPEDVIFNDIRSNATDYNYVDVMYFDEGRLTLCNNSEDSATNIFNKYMIEINEAICIDDIILEDYVVDMDTEETYQIEVTVTPTTADAATLVYESEDESIATVDANGLVTPVAQGSTNIRVYAPDRAVYNYVTVNIAEKVIPTAITAKKEEITLDVGSSVRAAVDFTPANTTKKNLTYESADVAIASVSARGVVTANAVGKTTITITGYNGITTSVVVNCVIPAETIAFAEDIYVTTLNKEDGTDFYPVIAPADSTQTILIWDSSNPEVCYVNEEGTLVKGKEGYCIIEATIKDTNISDELQIYIENPDKNYAVKKIDRNNTDSTTYCLLSDGSLWAWGQFLPVATKVMDEYVTDFVITNNNGISFINAAGEVYKCKKDGNKYSPETTNPIMTDCTAIFSDGADSYYAKKADGSLWAWGNYDNGQLGIGESNSTPAKVLIENEISKVVGFDYITIMLDVDGNAYLCGGRETNYTDPQLIQNHVKDIYLSIEQNYIMIDKGMSTLVYGISGRIDRSFSKESEQEIIDLNDSYYIEEGKVYFKGSNPYGRFGVGHNQYVNTYENMIGIDNAANVFVFNNNVYVATVDNKLYSAGYGNYYGNANASIEDVFVPERIYFDILKGKDALVLEKNNLQETENGELITNNENICLDFSEYLKEGLTYNTIMLEGPNGTLLNITKELKLDKLYITADFVKGNTYTLTIPREALSGKYGLYNDDLEFTFTYKFASSTGDVATNPDGDEIITGNEEIVEEEKVVHDTVKDEELLAARDKWTEATVTEEWEKFVEGGHNTRFYSNAILNRLNDDDVSTWLRITAPESGEYQTIGLGGNYWGTTNEKLINKQILDFDDYQSLADINEGEILTEAPSNTYPFVVDAYLEMGGEKVDTVGNDLVTFVVDFNRAMDTSIDLNVAFGSAYPYADYTVEGEWATDKQWRGEMQLKTLIENGYQYWSVSNGKAAGTSLKLYKDWGRFPFLIDTSAAQALTMDAEATETGIKLTWDQDDFETLAGYNLYRSTTEDGLYEKINKTVIPADTKTYFDENVIPGQKYFYNFTVVETDLTESEPSGKVIVTAMDTMAPDIYHSPVYNAFTGSNLVISATVTDNVAITGATLYYRTTGAEEWKSRVMTNNNDKYSAVIGSADITVDGLEYYIEATDGISKTYKGTADDPFAVAVQVAVAASAKGDVDANGAVEVADAMMVLQAINDRYNMTAEEFARADLDDSEELEAWEALRILQYVNGSIGSIL